MNEVFIEHMVKRKTPPSSILIKVVMIVATILCFCAVVLIPYALVLGMVMVFVDMYVFKMFDLEYEYTYIKGEVSIDKIMGKERRKKVGSFDFDKLEIIAPADSHSLDSFRNDNCKVKNYSTLEPDHKVYAMVLHKDGGYEKILFEPNMEMLQAMRDNYPRKVNI